MRRFHSGIISVALLVTAACANTQIVSSWHDPSATNVSFKSVIVIAMAKSETRRRAIEDRLVSDIESRGAMATASYRLISREATQSVDVVKLAVQKGNFDGAVTWRTIGVTTEAQYIPSIGGPGPRGFWGYYDVGWASEYSPGYLQTDRIIRVETMIYQVSPGNDRLIWAGTSDTVDPASLDSTIDGVADATINAMRAAGLFAPRP
jgi:hypothetical protein